MESKKTSLRLSERKLNRLKELADERGLSLNELLNKAKQLRLASIKTSQTNNDDRIRALNLMADYLEKNSKEIIEANIKDYKKAEIKGISKSLLSRLKLSKEKLNLFLPFIKP